ncbi:Ryanodine receptor 44F [Toxocara canis]|uniref:Ryanodine receptor 44F n=1 Tax=Toxocara canis TaxID=6265 RepID=A0A0B2V2Q3_TOXCA|nr:Ryanodine receptor 44F [Toxocara canis]
MAVRSSQNTITQHLLPGKDLLLQTKMRDHVSSMVPKILVGVVDGSAQFRRWYFEAEVEHIEQMTNTAPYLRIGWANTVGYKPFPGSGDGWGCNGVGDDFYSYGFDGRCIFFAGKGRVIGNAPLQKGDIVGCSLDLTIPEIRFTVNGAPTCGCFKNFNIDGYFFPVMSLSAKVSCRFIFGGTHGRLRFGPPQSFSAIVEAAPCELEVLECLSFGDLQKNTYSGPSTLHHNMEPFVPTPVDISSVILPHFAMDIHEKLAENLHELWAMRKIELGWTFGEVRDEIQRQHPCLTSFDRLPTNEKNYNINLAIDTLKTIDALGYNMVTEKPPTRLRPVRLPQNYQQSNGYKPQPLDAHEVVLGGEMMPLVDALAKNTHNVWAKEKIKRGWTFGLNEFVDSSQKRSPHLVPYELVDQRIKDANRESAIEFIRALQLFGIFLEPPVHEHDEGAEKELKAMCQFSRTYRAEATYAVTSGKWYFEFEVLTAGFMKVGWMDVSSQPDTQLGVDDRSYGFDGHLVRKWHQGAESYGREWKIGDIVGSFLDLNDRTIAFSLNGELLLFVDSSQKRSPHLVPYELVDQRIKDANRESAIEFIRALQLFGIFLEPPVHEHDEGAEKELKAMCQFSRTYRAEATYAVTSGKWYFEFEVLTAGFMKVGWMDVSSQPDTQLGVDDRSYGFDGHLVRKWHQGAESYGREWKIGDIVGSFLDLNDRTIAFSLNGELLLDPSGSEVAFDNVIAGDGFVPAMTLGPGQKARLNFGQDSNTLKYFTTSGLQEGYEPFCVNMYRQMPLWYGKRLSLFEDIGPNSSIEVSRIPATGNSPPCLKLMQKIDSSDTAAPEKAKMEYIRLSLPVKCSAEKELKAMCQFSRTYRAEATYAVTSGKWYFEFEVLTAGFMKVGWMDVSSQPDTQLGVDDRSYGFDGHLVRKWHQGAESYGREWKIGDIVGSFLDLNDRTIAFSLNGELLLDPSGSEVAFDNVIAGDGFVPAMTLGPGQKARLNFGQDSNTLKYFTTSGLQEGYEPFCVNMYRQMPLWYGKRLSLFEDIGPNSSIEVSRIPATGNSPPCLKLMQKIDSSDTAAPEKAKMEYIRLSLPVKCSKVFKGKDKEAVMRAIHELQARQSGVQMVIKGTTIPKEFEDSKEPLKKSLGRSLLSAFKHSEDDDIVLPGKSKQASFEEGPGEVTENPAISQRRRLITLLDYGVCSIDDTILTWLPLDGEDADELNEWIDAAQSQRRRLITLLDYGVCSIDDTILTWLPLDGEDADELNEWIDAAQRPVSLIDMTNDERTVMMDKMKDINGKGLQQKKTGLMARFREGHQKKKSAETTPVESKRTTSTHPPTLQNIGTKTSTSLDASSIEAENIASSAASKDMLSHDMPLSGPGRQSMLKKGSLKKKKKKEAAQASPIPHASLLMENRRPSILALETGPAAAEGSVPEDDVQAMNELADQIDEFYYGVRIFPGQDPASVWIGWVTPKYHFHSPNFNLSEAVRRCRFQEIDQYGNSMQSLEYRNCYVMNAAALLQAVPDAANTKVSGLLIGCIIDTSIGELSFLAAGQDTGIRFRLEPGAMLYPAAFVAPTSSEILQFELGRIKYTFPLSSAMFKSTRKSLIPFCPPRLTVEKLQPFHWARVPNECLRTTALKLSDVRGWSVLCDDPVRIMSIYVPEKDMSYDILEIIEQPSCLTFHRQTLNLYCKLAAHGNQKVAHILCAHVDEDQIMYAVKSHYLSGPMRQGFHDFLIAVHLKTHVDARISAAHEYVVPLVKELRTRNVFAPNSEDRFPQIYGKSVSIRPVMVCNEVQTVFGRDDEMRLLSPQFNFAALKAHVMSALKSAIEHAVINCRDLIGGNDLNHFEPLFKLFNSLLVVGLIEDDDLKYVLKLIHPSAFDENYEPGTKQKGLTEVDMAEGVKIQLVNILDNICDIQLRHRIESLVAFCEGFVGDLQQDQCARYMEIKQTDMPPAEAARRTKEFRCPPKEQMFRLLKCKVAADNSVGIIMDDDVEFDQCPMDESLQEQLREFCSLLVSKIGCAQEEINTDLDLIPLEDENSWVDNLAQLVIKVPPAPAQKDDSVEHMGTENFRRMIVNMLKSWSAGSVIENNTLIRQMFNLLLRQYSGVAELMTAMSKTYVLHERNVNDVQNFIEYLMQVRELLNVQFESAEEAVLKRGLWQLMNNRIFFQHPDLMRLLKVHEDVMTIMMNILTAQQGTAEHAEHEGSEQATAGQPIKDASEMVVACSRFLCYFCRTSRQNQKAMFEHLSFLLDNATMLLARPSLRGSVPLDVAYSSFMDNNELALALKEEELDKVAVYLSRCGLQPNSELVAKGYPDLGWDPVEGERYIDFLRFCVWINGESVEENANLVIRLLIRRPECLGVALKGEGQGLFSAFKEAIALSEDIRALEEEEDVHMLTSGILGDNPHYPSKETEEEDYIDLGAATLDFYSSLVDLLAKCAPDPLTIQAGKGDSLRARAILRSLISLDDLGQILSLRFTIPNLTTTAPIDEDVPSKLHPSDTFPIHRLSSLHGKKITSASAESTLTPQHSQAATATSITSAIATARYANAAEDEDFVDADVSSTSSVYTSAGEETPRRSPFLHRSRPSQVSVMSNAIGKKPRRSVNLYIGPLPGLLPNHKQSVLLFLDRVYGIDSQEMLFQLLEQSFLPDLRAATMMDSPRALESDNALALNRYLCNAVLPLLTNHSHFFADAEHHAALLDATLHTVYRMNRLQSLTKNQRDAVSDFLVAITRELPPAMMVKLMRKVIIDIKEMTENVLVPLRIITLHYERCTKYYGSGNSYGVASEVEKRLSMLLFDAIFDSLGSKPYDPELFGKALPCLTAIGSAISPDYALTVVGEDAEMVKARIDNGVWVPKPVDVSKYELNNELIAMTAKFAEHFHDSWSTRKLEKGWRHGELYSRQNLTHPRLKPFDLLKDFEKQFYKDRCSECIRALLAWNYQIELSDHDAAEKAANSHTSSGTSIENFNPRPVDLSTMTLEKDMMSAAEKMAEHSHNIWAKKVFNDLATKGGNMPIVLVPWDLLTDFERRKDRFRAAEILKFLRYHGYRVCCMRDSEPSTERIKMEGERSTVEKRFAYNLLEKLIQYLDQASVKMKTVKPSQELSRRNSFKKEGQDVKFFEKVVLPLMHAYFNAHRNYFLASSSIVQTGTASNKEKEMIANLFCRLASLLRIKNHAFGSVAKITVRCLQGLTQALDLRTLVKANSDIVRTSLLTFFNNCADDLYIAVKELKDGGQYSLLRGQNLTSWVSLEFAYQMIIPVLTTMFAHLAVNHFGTDLLVDEIQAACYKILDSAYLLTSLSGTSTERTSIGYETDKHRPGLGQCLSAFAACFPVAFLEAQYNKYNKYSVLAKTMDQSVQVQEMLQNLAAHIPMLESLLTDIEQASLNGTMYRDKPNVFDVDLPLMSSYLTYWWQMGPDGGSKSTQPTTDVTSEHMNRIFCALLRMMRDHVGIENAPWLCRVNFFAVQIIQHVTCDPVKDFLLPIAERLRRIVEKAYKDEEHMRTHPDDADEGTVAEDNARLVRDVYAFFPILMKYCDLHRAQWLKQPSWETDGIYENVAVIFKIWSLSQHFKREELNFMAQYEEGVLAAGASEMKTGKAAIAERKKKRREGQVRKDKHANSIVIACLKRLLPVGLNVFGGRELDIVQQTKEKFLAKESEEKIREFVRSLLDIPVKTDPTDKNAWQLNLYRKIGKSQMRGKEEMTQDAVVEKIINMGQVVAILHTDPTDKNAWQLNLYRKIGKSQMRGKEEMTQDAVVEKIINMGQVVAILHVTENPQASLSNAWKKMISNQRKRAVVACFRMVALYGIPRAAIHLLCLVLLLRFRTSLSTGLNSGQVTSRLEKEDRWKKVLTLQRKRMAISLITASHLYRVDKAAIHLLCLVLLLRFRTSLSTGLNSGQVTSRLEKEDRWKKVLTLQRKRMAISLITASHLYRVDKHRAINFFMPAFSKLWLEEEDVGQDKLIEELTAAEEEQEQTHVKYSDDDVLMIDENREEKEQARPDPLSQLIQCFQRAATSEQNQTSSIADDTLYVYFARVMSKSVHIEEEDDQGEEDGELDQAQKEEISQALRAEQAVLADRGAAIMCLMYLSASNGEPSEMVAETLQLGIHLLSGGNIDIQKMLINYLQLKKDVRFFTSLAGLMNKCSVLNLEMFERQIKASHAEGLGMGAELAAGDNQNLNDAEFTCSLFRFLQLTCEGHNLDFQNYLRTQPGHTTSVNLINCTVDYLLRLQESVMDFYWHYSSKEVIDEGGKEYFLRAIQVCSQVFNTLTESIQGPCVGNQMTLANSRLWDAINGFFFLFAHMMEKLYKNSTQLELLREFLNLQKDMIVLMLSMLEGNVLNGSIGKQMVDALVESQQCVEMILKFSDMFLKLKDLTTSQAFQDFDTNRDGWISPKEFQRAMESQKMYTVQLSQTIKTGYSYGVTAASALRPANVSKSLKNAADKIRSMTWAQLVFEISKLAFRGGCKLAIALYLAACTIFRFGYFLMTANKDEEEMEQAALPMPESQASRLQAQHSMEIPSYRQHSSREYDIFGVHMHSEVDQPPAPQFYAAEAEHAQPSPASQTEALRSPVTSQQPQSDVQSVGSAAFVGMPISQAGSEFGSAADYYEPKIAEQGSCRSRGSILNMLARNFKTIEKTTLYLAFFINVILLFHRVDITHNQVSGKLLFPYTVIVHCHNQ